MSISLLSKVKLKKSKFTGNPKSKIQNPKLPNHPMIVQRPLFNEGVLLATSLFMVALCACPSSGLCRRR
jgi:hypothetical protein